MEGRLANEAKMKKYVDPVLEEYPDLIDFVNYLSANSWCTKKEYVRYIHEFLKYAEKNYDILDFYDIDNVELRDVRKFIGNERMKYYALRKFYHYLLINEYVEKNPCDHIDAPKDTKEHKVVSLTLEEIKTIQNNIKNGVGTPRQIKKSKPYRSRDLAMIMLALTTGLRVASICEINVSDLDLEKGELTITEKGNKTRTIYLSNEIVNLIKKYLKDREKLLRNDKLNRNSLKDDQNALFLSCKRTRMTTPGVNGMLKKFTYNIDKPITFHKLRSTCATLLYENTQDIMVVRETLNHSDVKTTMRYIGAAEERLKKSRDAMSGLLFND